MTAAFRGSKNKFSMGTYQRTDEEDKAALWCIKNNMCITPIDIMYG